VPVRHPATQKVLGVVNLTCWRRDAHGMMAATAAALSRRIEASLLEQSGRREHALLHDYLTACGRNRDAVIAVGNDLLMLNDRARELLTPADQGPLLAEAVEALSTGRRQQLLVDLPSGRTARVQCKPSVSEGSPAGGVVQVQLIGRLSGGGTRAAMPPSLPAAVGSGAPWTKCRQAVDRAFRGREWLVLEGEAGTGKTTLAAPCTRAARRPRTCGSSTRRTTARAGPPTSPRSWRRVAGRSCSPTWTGYCPGRCTWSSRYSSGTASRPTPARAGWWQPSVGSAGSATPT
jgi:transcriptional regulator of acetoin/glycerol metabolism